MLSRDDITRKIASSKKYRDVYPVTIRRIAEECAARYGAAGAEERARNILHQAWASFYSSRPDFDALFLKFEARAKEEPLKEAVMPLLRLQSSTRERMPILDEFYEKIFSLTGMPDSIIDHACGLNPLTLPWMNLPESAVYTAYDIDAGQNRFLSRCMPILAPKKNVSVREGDLLAEEFEYADMIFLLKLLPVLQKQTSRPIGEILARQKCKYLVVSYPVTSLSGKQKGMTSFYRGQFMKMAEEQKWSVQELLFPTELVFVVER